MTLDTAVQVLGHLQEEFPGVQLVLVHDDGDTEASIAWPADDEELDMKIRTAFERLLQGAL